MDRAGSFSDDDEFVDCPSTPYLADDIRKLSRGTTLDETDSCYRYTKKNTSSRSIMEANIIGGNMSANDMTKSNGHSGESENTDSTLGTAAERMHCQSCDNTQTCVPSRPEKNGNTDYVIGISSNTLDVADCVHSRDVLENNNISSVKSNNRDANTDSDKQRNHPKLTRSESTIKSMFGQRVNRTLSNVDLDQCEPDICVGLLKIPSLKTYSAICKKLKHCSREWMQVMEE